MKMTTTSLKQKIGRPDIGEEFIVSTDKSRLNINTICGFLAKSYWAASRPKQTIIKSIENSLCYAAYHGERQVSFARIVTDYATYAYLCDVFVDEDYRGHGLGKLMVEHIMKNPDLANLRRFTLATNDAQGLYKKFGFDALSEEDQPRFMCILKEGV
jgi:ribosomal protein S18 acetylase RimI-like enzyme